MRRRDLLRSAASAGTATALGGSLWRCGAEPPETPAPTVSYGPLLPPDANDVRLPEGFTSTVVARSGERVPGTAYVWHDAPDGGACFADGDGWVYVSNSEIDDGGGGAGALRFTADGAVAGAYPILSGTDRNCSGGAMPWGAWLSCEEVPYGLVHETDPHGRGEAVARPALGSFRHEAAAADPDRGVVYLTEDEPDGCFYRFTPDVWGDLERGTLELLAGTDAAPEWIAVPDPSGESAETRAQVPGARRFAGGEGCYQRDGVCYFTTKHDNTVWAYDARTPALRVHYRAGGPAAVLTGVDNLTGTPAGDLFVAEDDGNMEVCRVAPDGTATPFLRVLGQDRSELTGVAFNPAGDRLYVSSQRGETGRNTGGITYEIRGPFSGA